MQPRPLEHVSTGIADVFPTTCEFTIVIPTYNEAGNVDEQVHRLSPALDGVRWEAIFVDDDSSDGTAARLRTMASIDARVERRPRGSVSDS